MGAAGVGVPIAAEPAAGGIVVAAQQVIGQPATPSIGQHYRRAQRSMTLPSLHPAQSGGKAMGRKTSAPRSGISNGSNMGSTPMNRIGRIHAMGGVVTSHKTVSAECA